MLVDNLIEKYGIGRLNDLYIFYKEVVSNGVTINDIGILIKENIDRIIGKEMSSINSILKPCPECGHSGFQLSPVNTSSNDRTKDNSTFVWWCPVCHHEVWEERSIVEIAKEARFIKPETTTPPCLKNVMNRRKKFISRSKRKRGAR
jgi:uncharacterized protein with PIN domain